MQEAVTYGKYSWKSWRRVWSIRRTAYPCWSPCSLLRYRRHRYKTLITINITFRNQRWTQEKNHTQLILNHEGKAKFWSKQLRMRPVRDKIWDIYVPDLVTQGMRLRLDAITITWSHERILLYDSSTVVLLPWQLGWQPYSKSNPLMKRWR